MFCPFVWVLSHTPVPGAAGLLPLSIGWGGVGVRGILLANFYVDVFRLGFLSLGQSDGLYAILILCRDFVRSDRRRQRDTPLEAAHKPLGAVNFRVLELAFAFPFAGNAQRAVMERDFDFVLLHARKFG